MDRPVKTPGPDHPVSVGEAGASMRAVCAGRVVAQSGNALVMREKDYPPVIYFPRESVDLSALASSPRTSWCPYKGEASYFSLKGEDGGAAIENIGWSYETPLPAMAAIAGHIAFYTSKVHVSAA